MTVFMYQLPYPPSVNHIYSRTKRGGVRLNPKARAYRNDVIWAIGKGHKGLRGDIKAIVDVFMPDKRKRDLDNVQKAVFDSLTYAGVWKDDSQIKQIIITNCGIEKPGRVLVSVSQI